MKLMTIQPGPVSPRRRRALNALFGLVELALIGASLYLAARFNWSWRVVVGLAAAWGLLDSAIGQVRRLIMSRLVPDEQLGENILGLNL